MSFSSISMNAFLVPRLLAFLLVQPAPSWINLISDTLIAISYGLFFTGIRWFVGKLRHSETMRSALWVLSSFNLFIAACGARILLRIVTLWHPPEKLALALKIICAVASLPPAIIFVRRSRAISSEISHFLAIRASEIRQSEILRKNQALLDRTNRIAHIGGWELDLLTNEVAWSDETARIHGMPVEFRPTLEQGIHFFAPEFRQIIIDTIQKGIEGAPPWELEVQLLRHDGQRVWVCILGEVEFLNGKPVRLFGSIQDKTLEFEQRIALSRSEILLDRTNHVAGIGGWELDLLTRTVTWSNETARIHGFPAGYQPAFEEAIGFFAPEDQQTLNKALEAAIQTGVNWDFELTLIRTDGRPLWVRLLAETEFLDGKPVRLFGSVQDKTEEVAQREILRKSQGFLDRTNRIAGVGGWELDILANTVTWSEETFRIHALPPTYTPTLEAGLGFYAPNSRPIIAAAVQHTLDTGEAWNLESQLVRTDGKIIWVRTVGSVEKMDGKPVRLIGAIQDITAQVNSRLALKSAKERVTLATDSGGIAIWDWTLEDDSFICDKWMARLYDVDFTDGPTPISTWSKKIHPDDWPRVLAALLDAIEGLKTYNTEFRVIWRDASVHHIKATGQVIRDESGRPLHMLGTNRDVTEPRRLAAELAQQHELLRVTLLSIGDAVISKDVHRNIVWMNGSAERMTGWSAAEAVGKPLSQVFSLIYQGSRLPAEAYIDPDSAKVRRIAMDEKVILVSRDNVERNVESCATPIYDAHANLIGSVIVLRDVTEQIRLARETEQINKLQLDLKLKDKFLSHVSHELRSPLTSVYSFTSIVADNLAGDTTEEQQLYLQIVLKNVLQLQAMIEDLLTVTQSKEGKLPIETEAVQVAPVILDAINASYAAAALKNIAIKRVDQNDLLTVRADPTRLCQIMMILLDNAIKFAPEGGHIDIRLVEDGQMLRFEVEDDGCGIPLDKRARVFEKLYQVTGAELADTSLAGRVGLGLGLHIARDLVRRQGGNIWVTGAPERGSIFVFTLPRAAVDKDSETPRSANLLGSETDGPPQTINPLSSAA